MVFNAVGQGFSAVGQGFSPARRLSFVPVACLLTLATLAAAPRAAAQPGPLAGFDEYVAKTVKDWQTPGLAVVVVKDGAVVFSKGYGVREVGKPHAVDAHTLFAIGSTTKAMTAALLGMLVDEKKLSWDDPVVKHLPWFELKDPYVTREVTVRDLLTHRAGLGNADFLWYGQTTGPREILQRARLVDPAYSLRSSFIYQNVMYAAAGAVAEAAGGQSWEQLVRTRIFEPLGMKESIATAATLARQPNVATPHDIIDGELRAIDNATVDGVAPAGSVWSSVHDLSKWMQLLLGGGRFDGRVVIQQATVDELFRPQTMVTREGFYPTAQLTKPNWTTYGLGWFQQDYRGRAVDFHTGSIDGMVAIHGLIRSERLGVFVLANRDHTELRHALMLNVFDRYLGGATRDWSVDLLKLYGDLQASVVAREKKIESRRVTGTSPTLELGRYTGIYSDPLRGDVLVTLEGGKLRARYGTAYVGALEHWHYDTFRAKWDAAWRGNAFVTFVLDANGQPAVLESMGARFARKPEGPRTSNQH
jgi:CubicO group peptidase (beta-lactamase class C family)